MLKRYCKSKNWKYNDIVSTVILILLNRRSDYGLNILHSVSDILGYSPTLNGMIYRLLSVLELNGLVQSEWKIEEQSQPKKFYTITKDGKKYLKERIELLNNQVDRLKYIINLYKGDVK